MTVTNARGHLSAEAIDLLLLSALSTTDERDARGHLETCAVCQQRWAELNEDSQKFKQYVFPRTLPKVQARLEGSRGGVLERLRLRLVLPALGLATAAALALTFAAGPGTQTEDDEYVGIKGAAAFELVAQRGGAAPFPVKDGATLHPKDKVRFVVEPASAKFVLVASLDGAQGFTVFHPFGATQSEAAPAASRVELASTIELDETMGDERVFVVLSHAPVTAAALEAAVRANPEAPKVEGATVLTRRFVKGAP